VICGLQGTSEGRKNNEKYKVSLKSGGVFQRPSCSGTTNNQMQSSPFPSHIALLLMVLFHVRKESNPPAFPLWMDPAGKFNAHVHHHHAAHASMFVEDQSSLSLFHTMPDAQQCFDTPDTIPPMRVQLKFFPMFPFVRLLMMGIQASDTLELLL
jgi:hypothetical protein